jgi:hypothetical protein
MSTPSAVNRPDAFHLGELVPGVETVGGSMVINSAAGAGTSLLVTIPTG